MDKFDELIIEALRENARQPVLAIAEKVNLSRSAVTDRIKKLEKTGIIKGYQVLLAEPEQQQVAAYFEICHDRSRTAEIAQLFRAIPEVRSCHGISGNSDLLVFVRADSMQRLHEIRQHLDGLKELTSIKTHMVISEWMDY